MAEKRVIKISAEIEPTLKGMNQIIQKLQEGLSKGSAQIDFTKGAGKQVSRLFNTFTDEYKKFQSLTKNGNLDVLDSKKALQSGEKIISTFRELQRIIGDFSSLTVVDAKKLFPDAFDKRVDSARESLQSISKAIETLNSKKINLATAESQLETLKAEAESLSKKLSAKEKYEVDVDGAKRNIDSLRQSYQKLQEEKVKAYREEQSQIATQQENLESKITKQKTKINNYGKTRKGEITYKGKTAGEWENSGATDKQKDSAQKAIVSYQKETQKLEQLITERENLQKRATAVSNILGTYDKTGDLNQAINKQAGAKNGVLAEDIANRDKLLESIEAQTSAENSLNEAQKKYNDEAEKVKDTETKYKNVTSEIAKQEVQIRKLKAEIDSAFTNIDFEKIKSAFASVGVTNITEETLKTKEGIEKLKESLNQLDSRSLEKLKSNLNDIGVSADKADKFVDKFRNGMDQAGQSAHEFTEHEKEVKQFHDRLLQFFSISNSVQLFKRAIRSAFETVKELDSAMTEIAVVSDFSVGDMWEKLPQFTAQANELGVAIKDTYNATALYIQQGLDLQHSMELSNETLKMARIAGMEAADATDAMTSALRGFNMELNETSAKRVNDVYSELAAITASDVQELSTAMSKTASIAHNVNMEFETTAAFLAQGIETTRESAETIGTALKTVIGRFSEVKSLYTKNQITGTDENGEEINVNKVQKALRAAGVDMTKFFVGEEGLDQVFLDLSKKWDSLDITTQRYL